jgi:F0F1-type ATP synthase assembly protein I
LIPIEESKPQIKEELLHSYSELVVGTVVSWFPEQVLPTAPHHLIPAALLLGFSLTLLF